MRVTIISALRFGTQFGELDIIMCVKDQVWVLHFDPEINSTADTLYASSIVYSNQRMARSVGDSRIFNFL